MNYALFLILNDVNRLEEIHKIFYEYGCGATTMDSVGMGKVLLDNNVDIPIFAGIRKLVEGNKPYNKTIISVIRDEAKLKEVTTRIQSVLGVEKMNQGGVGFMFVVPVLDCYGFCADTPSA